MKTQMILLILYAPNAMMYVYSVMVEVLIIVKEILALMVIF